MPSPSASQLESLAKSAVENAGLKGQDAPGLAEAMGETFAEALRLFASQTQVLPGIPAAVVVNTGAGTTTGPGMLLPPPAGGASASQIEPIASAALQRAGLAGANIPELAGVLADACEQGLSMLCAQVQVAPGIPVTGMATAAPGRLI